MNGANASNLNLDLPNSLDLIFGKNIGNRFLLFLRKLCHRLAELGHLLLTLVFIQFPQSPEVQLRSFEFLHRQFNALELEVFQLDLFLNRFIHHKLSEAATTLTTSAETAKSTSSTGATATTGLCHAGRLSEQAQCHRERRNKCKSFHFHQPLLYRIKQSLSFYLTREAFDHEQAMKLIH